MTLDLLKYCKTFKAPHSEWRLNEEARYLFFKCFDHDSQVKIISKSINNCVIGVEQYDRHATVRVTYKGMWKVLMNNPDIVENFDPSRGYYVNIHDILSCFPMLLDSKNVISTQASRFVNWDYNLTDDYDGTIKDFMELMETKKSAGYKTLYRSIIKNHPEAFSKITSDIAQSSCWSAKELASLFNYKELQAYYKGKTISNGTKTLLEWIKSEVLLEVLSGKQKKTKNVVDNLKNIEQYL